MALQIRGLKSESNAGPVVGIDLGTTNSLVSAIKGGKPYVIADTLTGEKMLPSVVTFQEGGTKPRVGSEARKARFERPEDTVFSIKRLMGRGLQEAASDAGFFPGGLTGDPSLVRVRAGGREWTPPEISSFILGALKQKAEAHFGQNVQRAVVTVPAYFNDAQRQATKDAAKLAGLEVLRIINEPTAAALAYGLGGQGPGEKTIAVFDLGGGTFDVSLLRIQADVYEVLATNGDTRLGGDDLDRAVAAHLARRAGANDQDPRVLEEFRGAGEEMKKVLSTQSEARARTASGKEVRLSRVEFESLIRPLIERTLPPCRQAIKDAGLDPSRIQEVVLVGGSTQIPLVRALVRDLFKKEPRSEVDPYEAVALGAAIQADVLAGGNRSVLLLDVTPLSLGLETMGGVMSVLIPRNTAIPASAKQLFTTFVDNQTGVDVHVLQGEREMAADCRSLARFKLKIPPQPAGIPRVEVNFLIDANGILNVQARDVRSGQSQGIEVKPSYGLSEGDMERMLKESFANAQTDMRERALIEARNEATSLVKVTERTLAGSATSPEERAVIALALAALKAVLASDDVDRIRALTLDLDKDTTPLAQRLMDLTLGETLETKQLKDL